MNGRASFAVGLFLSGLTILARVYSWPDALRWALSIVGLAMLAALAGAVWNYTEYLLRRPKDEAQVALTRAKILALFCLGGVTASAAQIVLIAGSIWIGGIS